MIIFASLTRNVADSICYKELTPLICMAATHAI